MYVCKPTGKPKAKLRAQLFGSGTILTEALKAQQMLEEQYSVGADVWSVTSYVNLYRDGHAAERWNRLHPADKPRVPYVTQVTKDAPGVFVAASDYLKVLPDAIDRWLPRSCTRSAPTASAAARRGRPCATSSKSTRASSCSPRCMRLMQEKQIEPRSWPRRSRTSGSTPRSRTRPSASGRAGGSPSEARVPVQGPSAECAAL